MPQRFRRFVLVLALVWIAALTIGRSLASEATGDSWWSDVQQRIAASEYEVTWQERTVLPDLDQAWHAANRAHDLRSYFTTEGIRLVRRTESEPSWELALSLVGYGRGEKILPVGEPELSSRGNRIDYHRRGQIRDWFVNAPRGVEQGFTLAGPPEEFRRAEARSFLELALGGSLSPVISEDGQAIDFAAPGGARVLRLAELRVTDAGGRRLRAWMEGFAGTPSRGIRIVCDDAEATYPLSVKGLWTSPAWIAESDQEDAEFGYSASTAGDVNGDGYADVIVGARRFDNGQLNEGRVFGYHGSASGLSATASWLAESDQVGALFGGSVSTAGDVNGDGYADVIVGAHFYDNGESQEGAAFVYHGSTTGLDAAPAWAVEGNLASAILGAAVSAAGDVNGDGYADVIVSAHGYDNDQANEGRAYVYHGSAAGLSATADWFDEGDQTAAFFGISVSTAGDVNGDRYADVVVGAWQYDGGQSDEGRAFVYHGSASGLSPAPDWTAESDQADALFGVSVSTAGDVDGDGYADVIVGASRYDNGQTDEGRAFVYLGSASGLSAGASWTAESNLARSELGRRVSTAGDVNGDGYADVVFGVHLYGCEFPPCLPDFSDRGRAVVHHGSAAGLSPVADWTIDGDQAGSQFGWSVSPAGDVNGDGYSDVIAGAPFYDNGEAGEGRAYVYHGSASGLTRAAGWTAESDQDEAWFGYSVSTAGDVNGDGYADVIVGALGYDNGHFYEGQAYVYNGSADGLNVGPAWTFESNRPGAQFGRSVSTAGDVNGDGYADIIVGANGYDGIWNAEGRVYVFHGSAAGPSTSEDWAANGTHELARFGTSVSAAGDVNGDGYGDVIVGADIFENGEDNEGGAFVYHGSASGLSPEEDWSAEGNQNGAWLGFSVSTAGDVNGDGYADVIVGAPFYENPLVIEGRAHVYHGSAAGLGSGAAWIAEGEQTGARFGWSVSQAGDVDGDGYADVIVGAPYYTDDQQNEGRAFVFSGSASGLSASPTWTAESNQVIFPHLPRFGKSVSTAGDVNGDGFADVIVGADGYFNGQTDEGRAFVYHGSAAGPSPAPDWTAESDQEGAQFGISVSSAGDVNGDGYADVIVGAYLYDNGNEDEGRAYVYYGGGGLGPSLVPQQWQPTDDVPIGALGRSDEPDRFRLRLLGRSPYGGGRAKLEWEVKPLGTLFDGQNTATGASWTELVASAPQLGESATGLVDDTPHHWRVRLSYDPTSTPYQKFSRWVTLPRDGWNETDLRTFGDGDGIPADLDCDEADSTVWSTPGEATALAISADKATFSWGPPLAPGGTNLRYDLLRSPHPDDFVAPADCAANDEQTRTAIDETDPAPGGLLAYLVRAENDCPDGSGSLGQSSADVDREGRTCP